MKALLISTNDLVGGAARATLRLHHGLLDSDIDSHILVQTKSGDSHRVHTASGKLSKGINVLRPTFDSLLLNIFSPSVETHFSLQWFPDRIISSVAALQPDVINLHWINKGFVQIETIRKIKQPIIWTLHDMWPFTGGCHHSFMCGRYQATCGSCPQLNSNREFDLSRLVWQRKKRAWQDIDLIIVCPSRWLATHAEQSSLFGNYRIEVINNGIDCNCYRPFNRQQARSWLGLPSDKQLILFGAMGATKNIYKGYNYLQDALQLLSSMDWQNQVELVVFGESSPEESVGSPVKTHYLGYLHDDVSLALVYNAVDVFVSPSVQDNFPNTVLEALACGIPCVSFDVGGLSELVDHKISGFLAPPKDAKVLAQGIDWVLHDKNRWRLLSENARAKVVREFDHIQQSKKYLNLFEEIIKDRKGYYPRLG